MKFEFQIMEITELESEIRELENSYAEGMSDEMDACALNRMWGLIKELSTEIIKRKVQN